MSYESDNDSDYSNEGRNSPGPASGEDATEYGGRYAGSSQTYNPVTNSFGPNPDFDPTGDREFDYLGSPVTSPYKGVFGWFQPGSWGYNLGLRDPGSPAAIDPDRYETAMERNLRMGIIGDFINTIGTSAISAAMPAPVSLGLSGLKAYKQYQKTGSISDALSGMFSGAGGWAGAAANAVQGNYGAALGAGLSKMGVSPLGSMFAGTLVDAAQDKPISKNLGGLFGRAIGDQIGPGYGKLGQNIGTSLSKHFSRK